MKASDFERLKESVREMVAVKTGQTAPSRKYKYAGKVLVEIEEDGRSVWNLARAATDLREDIKEGEAEHPDSPGERIRFTRRALLQTQEGFAELLNIPVSTLRNWEQGRRMPEGAASTLIRVLYRRPDAVLDSVRHDEDLQLESR